MSRRALKHRLHRPALASASAAKREAVAEWRRQTIAAIREPSLKSGVITLGSGFGGTGKTDVAVTLAAIYAAARPADRVILADSNDDMPHGYIRLGGIPVEALPHHQRTLSIRGFYQACTEGSIKVYADLRDAVAWLQGVAVIRGDTADECMGIDFGEQEYLAVLEFLQCMSNIVINDGGTGLFAKLQVGTLLHGDKYVFVTEASQLGYWSIGQVFSRYRNYEGEKERPLTEAEMKHLRGLMDEATIVVDKFIETDPEQVRWHTRICEASRAPRCRWSRPRGTRRWPTGWPLDLGAVSRGDARRQAGHGRGGAARRRPGQPQPPGPARGGGRRRRQRPVGSGRPPPRWYSQPVPPPGMPDPQEMPNGPAPDVQEIPNGPAPELQEMPNGAAPGPPEMPNGAAPERPGEEQLADAGGQAEDASRPRWPDSH